MRRVVSFRGDAADFAVRALLGVQKKVFSYDELVNRIDVTPDLEKYRAALLYDWPNWQEHVDWACTASVAEIVAWAKTVDIRE